MDFTEVIKSYHGPYSFTEQSDFNRELIRSLESEVNYFGYKPSDTLEKIKEAGGLAEMNLENLAAEWVSIWSKNGYTDDRNEDSVNMCRKIAEIYNEKTGKYPYRFERGERLYPHLEDCAYSMHKTLMQSASNLFVKVLRDKDPLVRNVTNKEWGIDDTKDVRFPMI